ncbi:MAG: hypothetical protein IT450_15410 [Phycisphaerales bacterium]|nr:hypothetical protein [Phycisphaerales bacterium]
MPNGNDNGAGNTNDNGTGNTNDNGAGNTNDNGVPNGNDNGAGNTNDNGTGNTNDNGAGNTNDNGVPNGNDNGAGNTNDNGTGNTNDNGAGNTNDNGAGNTNDNGAGNTNDNGAGNGNDNGGNGNDNGSCPDGSTQFRAQMSGDDSNEAEYRNLVSGCSRFRARVRSLQAFTTYPVAINGVIVGQITTDDRGRGELEYSPIPSGFPAVQAGDVITVGPVSGVFVDDCSANANCNG